MLQPGCAEKLPEEHGGFLGPGRARRIRLGRSEWGVSANREEEREENWGGGEGLPRPGLGAGGHKLGVEDGPGVGPSEIVKGFEKQGKNACYVYRL